MKVAAIIFLGILVVEENTASDRRVRKDVSGSQDKVDTQESGYITSFGYPSNYPNDYVSNQVIKVGRDKIIRVTFLDFDLEFGGSCNYDYLLIKDSNLRSDNLLGKFCGNKLPNDVKSSGNSLQIFFKSDNAITSKGYMLRWETLPRPGRNTARKTGRRFNRPGSKQTRVRRDVTGVNNHGVIGVSNHGVRRFPDRQAAVNRRSGNSERKNRPAHPFNHHHGRRPFLGTVLGK